MVKILYNNILIDYCKDERYLKYSPAQDRFTEVKRYCANAILGSDGNTVYHLEGTAYNFKEEKKTVRVVKINEAEYRKIATQFFAQQLKETALTEEIQDLKKLVNQQSQLIQSLLGIIK